jgi:diaminohydroxyphosphoribosylaminopyrimidine deaminase/5-amino-6-(5-phosphoribosylamino)uracil reductase
MTASRPEPTVNDVWDLLRVLAEFRPAPDPSPSELVLSACSSSNGAEPVVRLGEDPAAVLVYRSSRVSCAARLSAEARELFELYAPLCQPVLCPSGSVSRAVPRAGSFVVAHLGQSLDGRIAPPSGKPEAITGPEDMTHNHRMRALFDAVLVGAGTVCHDDPTLTVRHCAGRNPVRVVVDPDRRLSSNFGIFRDGLAPTLLLCRRELTGNGGRHGLAEVVGVEGGCEPRALVDALRVRGLERIFIEGGGVTVSRFLAAGCLDRLQIAVSPMIMGQGRPGLDLEQTLRLRPHVRRFNFAEDVLFECCFDHG